MRAAAGDRPLPGAPIVPTSSATGRGIDELRAALATRRARCPARATRICSVMPVDRAFTMSGTGTVVTGTVWSGTLRATRPSASFRRRCRARARPSGARHAVRASCTPASAPAIALAGVELDHAWDGARCSSRRRLAPVPPCCAPTSRFSPTRRARVGPRSRVRLHLGTSEVGARLVVAGGALAPGEHRPARIVVDEAQSSRAAGDRFVLRAASPLGTRRRRRRHRSPAPRRARAVASASRDAVADGARHLLREAGAVRAFDVARASPSGSATAEQRAAACSTSVVRVARGGRDCISAGRAELVVERATITLTDSTPSIRSTPARRASGFAPGVRRTVTIVDARARRSSSRRASSCWSRGGVARRVHAGSPSGQRLSPPSWSTRPD